MMVKIKQNELCKSPAAAAAAASLLSVHDEMSVAAAPVDVLDVPGSAPPPAVGEAAAWPQAVVRLQAAVHREVVVLHQAPTQALRTLRTLHPGVGGVFGRSVAGAVRPEVLLNVGGSGGRPS